MSMQAPLEFPEFPGWDSARRESLPGDASTRRFLRLSRDENRYPVSAILMIYHEDCDPEELVRFHEISESLAQRDLPVPKVLGLSLERRHLLVEDLGDDTLQIVLSKGASPSPYYEECLRLLEQLQKDDDPTPSIGGRRLDFALFMKELHHTKTWLWQNLLQQNQSSPEWDHGFEELSRALDQLPRVVCHRDFHSRNLMVLSDSTLAMVDFQDCQWGPLTYDLASLLYDAYVEIPDSLVETLRQSIPTEHQPSLDMAVAQRMIKAAGTFAYQAAKMGRPKYLSCIGPALRDAKQALQRLDRFAPVYDFTLEIEKAWATLSD